MPGLPISRIATATDLHSGAGCRACISCRKIACAQRINRSVEALRFSAHRGHGRSDVSVRSRLRQRAAGMPGREKSFSASSKRPKIVGALEQGKIERKGTRFRSSQAFACGASIDRTGTESHCRIAAPDCRIKVAHSAQVGRSKRYLTPAIESRPSFRLR
jgi:hypothetical protein